MAEFNVNLPEPQGRGSAPVGGFSPYQPQGGIPKIIGDAVNIFADGMSQRREQKALEAQNQILGEYTRSITSLNDAMAQGALDPREAATRSRARTNEFMANYPQFTEEFKKISQGLRSETELGEALEEEQFQQDLRRQVIKDAVSAGAVIPQNASEEYVDTVIETFQSMRAESTLFETHAKRMAEARASAAEDRASQVHFEREMAVRNLTSMGASKGVEAMAFSNDVVERRRAGEDPMALVQDINNYFGNLEMAIGQIASFAPERAAPIRGVFSNMRDTALQYANGEIEQDVYARQLSTLETKLRLTALIEEPTLQAMAGASPYLENIPAALLESNTAMRNLLKMSSDRGGMVNPFEEDSKQFFTLLRDRSGFLRGNTYQDKDGAVEGLSNATNNALKAIGRADPEDVTPSMMTDAAKFVASEEFKILAFDEGGRINPEYARTAREALDFIFSNEVKRSVTEKLGQPYRDGTLGDTVTISFSGSGVEFAAVERQFSRPVDSMERRSFARTFNRTAESVNLLLRMGAHLEGRTDYKEYWEENKHTIMPSYFPSPTRIEQARANGYEYVEGRPWVSESAWRRITNE